MLYRMRGFGSAAQPMKLYQFTVSTLITLKWFSTQCLHMSISLCFSFSFFAYASMEIVWTDTRVFVFRQSFNHNGQQDYGQISVSLCTLFISSYNSFVFNQNRIFPTQHTHVIHKIRYGSFLQYMRIELTCNRSSSSSLFRFLFDDIFFESAHSFSVGMYFIVAISKRFTI